MTTWVRAQRRAGIENAVERQRHHVHTEGRFRFLAPGLGDRSVYSLECVDCGAIIAIYGWRRQRDQPWELVQKYHCADA